MDLGVKFMTVLLSSTHKVLVPSDDNEKCYAIREGDTIAGYVAATRVTLNINILGEVSTLTNTCIYSYKQLLSHSAWLLS